MKSINRFLNVVSGAALLSVSAFPLQANAVARVFLRGYNNASATRNWSDLQNWGAYRPTTDYDSVNNQYFLSAAGVQPTYADEAYIGPNSAFNGSDSSTSYNVNLDVDASASRLWVGYYGLTGSTVEPVATNQYWQNLAAAIDGTKTLTLTNYGATTLKEVFSSRYASGDFTVNVPLSVQCYTANVQSIFNGNSHYMTTFNGTIANSNEGNSKTWAIMTFRLASTQDGGVAKDGTGFKINGTITSTEKNVLLSSAKSTGAALVQNDSRLGWIEFSNAEKHNIPNIEFWSKVKLNLNSANFATQNGAGYIFYSSGTIKVSSDKQFNNSALTVYRQAEGDASGLLLLDGNSSTFDDTGAKAGIASISFNNTKKTASSSSDFTVDYGSNSIAQNLYVGTIERDSDAIENAVVVKNYNLGSDHFYLDFDLTNTYWLDKDGKCSALIFEGYTDGYYIDVSLVKSGDFAGAYEYTPTLIPEPAAFCGVLGLFAVALAFVRRKR